MTELSLSAINAKFPYILRKSELGGFDFDAESGLTYNIALIRDYTLGDEFETYMLNILPHSMGEYERIRREHLVKVRSDHKIKGTLVAVLEVAMENKNIVIDYVCLSDDHKQGIRARLFEKWFNELASSEMYQLFSTSITVENETNYLGAFVRRDNDRYDDFCETFKRFDSNIHKDGVWNVEN